VDRARGASKNEDPEQIGSGSPRPASPSRTPTRSRRRRRYERAPNWSRPMTRFPRWTRSWTSSGFRP